MKKTAQFRRLLHSDQLEFLLEAHDGISARIGEEAGFAGLWASGLCISGQLAVRDSNEASWTQVLEVLEFMADATSVPILLDGDTGYGNFNSMRRLVHKLEQRDVAAVCIEDKLFPKTNSFIRGETQPLADAEEFAGKIKAGKDAQRDGDFSIVARVEALIAGWGLGEALERAHAYADAGADAILIHSAKSVPDEVLAFKKEWNRECPVVIVPTRYYSTPTDVFHDAGFSIVIWANHVLRGAVGAMQRVAATLAREQNLLAVEDEVVPVAEIFRLQGAAELADAERRYLPAKHAATRAVVLAASRGAELGELTETLPKALVEVTGRPLLQHIVDAYNAVGIKDLTVVRGFAKEAFRLPNLRYVDNDAYETTGELDSLKIALEALPDAAGDTLVVSYGDVLFSKFVPEILCDSDADLAVAVDTDWHASANRDREADYARCSAPYSRRVFYEPVHLERVATDLPEDARHGEWMGFLKVGPAARPALRAAVERLVAGGGGRKATLPLLMNELVAGGHRIEVLYTSGHWLDVDNLADVVRAGDFPGAERARMIRAMDFVEPARELGYRLYTGVPCSYLKPFINHVLGAEELRYVPAANEGDAVAIAAGSALGGAPAVCMFQNSGLGNAVSPLSSLTYTFRIPVLLIVTHRGQPGGAPDEPQHELMGRITGSMLELLGIPWETFPTAAGEVGGVLERARSTMRERSAPYALVMSRGAVEPGPAPPAPVLRAPEPLDLPAPLAPVADRRAMLAAVRAAAREDDVLIASTGYAGRELYALGDAPNQLYMVGSMGCASSLGLGLALAQPRRRAIVLDGDGAAIMRLGALTTLGCERPPNLVHVVLDNGQHESTGGQWTVTHTTDLAAVAAACGYPAVDRVTEAEELAELLESSTAGLRFVHARILPGVPSALPRPSITPAEVAARLRGHLGKP